MKYEIKFFCRDCDAKNIRVACLDNPFNSANMYTCSNCMKLASDHKIKYIVEVKPENKEYILSPEAEEQLDHLEKMAKETRIKTLSDLWEYMEKNFKGNIDQWEKYNLEPKDIKYTVTLRQPCTCAEWEPFYHCYSSGKDFMEPVCNKCLCSVSTDVTDILDMQIEPYFSCLSCDVTLYERKEGEVRLCDLCNSTYQKVNQLFNTSEAVLGQHVPPLQGQILRRVAVLNGADYGEPSVSREIVAEVKNANIITSEVAGTHDHKPVLDIDLSCKLIPSTNAGHYHLYIDKQMSWDKYKKLLAALKDGGIIESGYYQAALARKYTGVRLPWIKKSNDSV